MIVMLTKHFQLGKEINNLCHGMKPNSEVESKLRGCPEGAYQKKGVNMIVWICCSAISNRQVKINI